MGKQTVVGKIAGSAATIESTATPEIQPTHINKAKDTFGAITAALPIIGASGTLFVWIAANYYVGDVEVNLNAKFDHILVKVYDSKGHESTFHTPRFQVWPGSYHFEIAADNGKAQHADANVGFHEKTLIPVTLEPSAQAAPASTEAAPTAAEPTKRAWWKLWRR